MASNSLKVDHINAYQCIQYNHDLDSYQRIQYDHDKLYHPEILCLGVLGRMKHIVLHLMKYRAALSAYQEDDIKNKQAFVDTFIMLVSACNTLNLRISTFDFNDATKQDFLEDYLQIVGNLSKACESADHQEDFPINSTWKSNIELLLKKLLKEAANRNLELLNLSKVRLEKVEDKNSLHFILKDNS